MWPLFAQTTSPQPSSSPAHSVTKAPPSKAKSKSKASAARPTTGTKGASSRANAAKPAAAKTTAARTKAKSKGKPVTRTARSYQQAPTPERYQEIQQALAKKGYFQGEANGRWGPDSIDALKRFQAEQNLMPDGKINSLSLIALGLGPKRLSAQSKPASTTAPAPSVVPQ